MSDLTNHYVKIHEMSLYNIVISLFSYLLTEYNIGTINFIAIFTWFVLILALKAAEHFVLIKIKI